MSFQTASTAPQNCTLPRDRDGPPFFLDLSAYQEGDWNLFHWRHVPSHAYFWLLFWVCEQNHFIKPFFRRQMRNLSFPLVTRKWPQQSWWELVKLLQPSRPEWGRRLCFARLSQSRRQLPRRPSADKALFLLAIPLLGWGPSCWASEPARVVELYVQPGKWDRGR